MTAAIDIIDDCYRKVIHVAEAPSWLRPVDPDGARIQASSKSVTITESVAEVFPKTAQKRCTPRTSSAGDGARAVTRLRDDPYQCGP